MKSINILIRIKTKFSILFLEESSLELFSLIYIIIII